jgi:NAD(P)-dependent dehydrogenase (short-subunit alcohol dehydrogenase family)
MDTVDLTGKVSLVTGATGDMGKVIVTDLARLGSTVVIVARDRDRGERVRRQVAEEIGADRVEVLVGDLASPSDLRQIADEFSARHDQLQVLVNNAGAHYRDRQVTPDGVEMHLAVNHLAGFTLTALLLDRLKAGAPARVVNVVSDTMNDTRQVKIGPTPRPVTLDPEDLHDLRRINPADGFVPFEAYARAKLLTTMCGYLLADQLDGSGVTVNSVHPGLVDTGIVDAIVPAVFKPFLGPVRRALLTPAEGAAAALRLATASDLTGLTGRYFTRDKQSRTPAMSYDPELRKLVWATSMDHVTSKRGGKS